MIASIRHEDTAYDELLMSGVERAEARERLREDVDRILRHWRLARPETARQAATDLVG